MIEADGRVVARAGVTALPFRIGDERVRGAYSVAAMTHPDLRGRGLFLRSAKALYARLEREGALLEGLVLEHAEQRPLDRQLLDQSTPDQQRRWMSCRGEGQRERGRVERSEHRGREAGLALLHAHHLVVEPGDGLAR